MHLFKTNNTPTETAAMEKLLTWWYYVQCLGSRVWHHFDQVSVSFHLCLSLSQFLCFMYKFHSFMHASYIYYKLCPVVLLFVVVSSISVLQHSVINILCVSSSSSP